MVEKVTLKNQVSGDIVGITGLSYDYCNDHLQVPVWGLGGVVAYLRQIW